MTWQTRGHHASISVFDGRQSHDPLEPAILVVRLIGARVWRRLAANRGVTANAPNFIRAMSSSRIRDQAKVAYLLEPRQIPFRLGALKTITVGLLFTNPTVSAIARRPRTEKLSQIRTELIAQVLRLKLIYLSKDQARQQQLQDALGIAFDRCAAVDGKAYQMPILIGLKAHAPERPRWPGEDHRLVRTRCHPR